MNSYKLQHINKDKLQREGKLCDNVTCEMELVEKCLEYTCRINQRQKKLHTILLVSVSQKMFNSTRNMLNVPSFNHTMYG